jgi:stage V sporulation protein R
MEGCKERASQVGLQFQGDTLEYMVTNRDLLELSPKMMIPTLYDYWVHDVEVMREKGRYDLYPTNPFETVINTRPAISFYNDNNPDWLNVMIFYHVLAHIDFFQNNIYFQHTWQDDFNGEALADKRLIARLRSEKGRWLDYIIEFARCIDNLVGYQTELSRLEQPWKSRQEQMIDYYFDIFLQSEIKVSTQKYLKEIEEYNKWTKEHGEMGIQLFFAEVRKQYPEFDEKLRRYHEEPQKNRRCDLIQYLINNSAFLNTYENKWMISVIEVIRRTSLFFQPQMRTKIMNEGWATIWHERLFLDDDRIQGHEVDFARTHSKVAALSRISVNAYALGLRLFQQIEEAANKGKFSFVFERIADIAQRKEYNKNSHQGQNMIFQIRKYYCDSMFIQDFVTQDFVNKHKLFVAGKKLNKGKRTWEYYIKSRKAEEYRQMLLDNLYHPPYITFAQKNNGMLYLRHHFEGKPLVKEYIPNTLLGIEYLWGNPVQLETHEVVSYQSPKEQGDQPEIQWKKMLYTMEKRKLSKRVLDEFST